MVLKSTNEMTRSRLSVVTRDGCIRLAPLSILLSALCFHEFSLLIFVRLLIQLLTFLDYFLLRLLRVLYSYSFLMVGGVIL